MRLLDLGFLGAFSTAEESYKTTEDAARHTHTHENNHNLLHTCLLLTVCLSWTLKAVQIAVAAMERESQIDSVEQLERMALVEH